jgi:peptidoglycan/LPS O-acetylase OafA/YrhL
MNADERIKGRGFESSRAAIMLRVTSVIALVLAVFSAVILATLGLVRCFQPNLPPWTLKSAMPLILIGIAFAAIQFVVRRTRAQILLGLMVAVAFILWGSEQFVSDQAIASLIDDLVVLLFVIDLSIVICAHLKPGVHPVSKELPFDEPCG